jgi:peroxiredoxin
MSSLGTLKRRRLVKCFVAFLAVACIQRQGRSELEAAESAPTIKEFSVELVDISGKPVEGADIGLAACIGDYVREFAAKDKTEWYYARHIRSDAKGIARCNDKDTDLRFTGLIARHEGRKISAIASIDPEQLDQPIKLTLVPECVVEGEAICPELAERQRNINGIVVYVRLGEKLLIESEFKTPAFRLMLPPGQFEFEVYGTETHHTARQVQVPEKTARLQVEPIELKATQLALLEGRPAPEIPDVLAWKNSEPIKLVDLRGKCVLLEFWGYWCGSCTYRMPELFKLYDTYHDQGLEIIGIHVDLGPDKQENVDTAAKLDARLTQTRKEQWDGRDLPFPVAIVSGNRVPFGEGHSSEARGKAAAAYGIISYPTQLLIDRKGNVVGRFFPNETGIAELEKALSEK